MTTILSNRCTCAVCGATTEYTVLGSTNAFGSPDLDLRPPEMERSTMSLWVQECPSCGYVASSIEKPTTVTRGFLNSQEYLSCDGNCFKSGLADMFYKQHMICLREGNKTAAFFALLHAAWACDDNGDRDNAIKCRMLTLSLVSELITTDAEHKDSLMLMKADILRRAERFDELRTEYAFVRFDDDLLDSILAFQLSLAEKGDAGCYQVADATE